MTFVGVFGLLLGLLGFVLILRPTRLRVAVLALAYLMHVAAALFYYQLASDGVADSNFYYYDPNYMYEAGFGLNTAFIVYIVQLPKSVFGGTFLDYFLVFQALGFWGVATLYRIFEEIYQEVDLPQPIYTYIIIFLPSLHYWTAAVGKDSLFFFAICISLWASMQYRKRLVMLAIGMLLMLAIRPHVAVIAGAAFAVTVLIDRRTGLAVKLPLFAISAAGTVFAMAKVWSTFQIDLTDVDVFSDVLAGQEAMATSDSGGRTAVTGSYPVRLLSLLFRPLFFDASGVLGLIVSVENAILFVMLALMIARFSMTASLARQIAFVRYALVSSLVVTIVLALGYYNVGLGIRQKATMILPGILVAFVATRALRSARKMAPPAQEMQPGQPSFG